MKRDNEILDSNYIKLDWSISNYDDRVKFLKEKGYLDELAMSPNKAITPARLEHITTFLFRSEDIQSGRKDKKHPFYRDDSEFNRSSSKVSFSLDDNTTSDGYDTLTKEDYLYGRLKYSNVVNPYEKSGIELYHENIDSLFDSKNINYRTLRNILNYSSVFTEDRHGFSENLKLNIEKVIAKIYSSCRNDINIKIISMLIDGFTEVEISEEISMSQQAVNKRIRKIFDLTIESF